MSDQITSQLEQIDLQDSTDVSHSPPHNLRVDPFRSLPPEIISHIFYHCVAHTYEAEKVRYARFCLVNKQFLPIAREHLYSRLTLTVPTIPSKELLEKCTQKLSEEILKEVKVIITLLGSPQSAKLVKVLDVAFEDIPPPEDSGRTLCDLLVRLTELQELWLLDMGKGFWRSTSTRTTLDTSTDIIYRLTSTLAWVQTTSLKILVIPQLQLRPIDTYTLFTSITSLETYKGTILALPSGYSGQLSKTSVCRLHRLYVTQFQDPRDLNFVLSASYATLAYLHLTFHLDNDSIDLSGLRSLETLILTIQYNGPGAFVANSIDEAKAATQRYRTITNLFLEKVFETAESARRIDSLKTFSFFTNLNDFLAPHFQNHFLHLPSSIEELSVGPNPVSYLPWSILLENIDLYPSLRKLYLSPPRTSTPPISPSQVYFGMTEEDLRERYKLGMKWIDDEYDWKYWGENRFYPQASIQEMMGKPNEFAWRQEQQQNCIVS